MRLYVSIHLRIYMVVETSRRRITVEIIYFYRLLHWVKAGTTTIIIMQGVLGRAFSGGKSTLLITS